MSESLFDVVVIDTNFFISLLNAGVSDSLMPHLQSIGQSVGMEIMVPDEIPKSDIPGRFRQLRRLIPKYIRTEPVKRSSKLWNRTAEYAVQERMVRVNDDPADIDVVILAKKFSLKDNNKVALVSDDEGVARIIKENKVFKGIDHLSCGSFVSILAASVSDPKMRKILDQTVERVFRASWSYKKKTRRYIDVAMLIDDLTDTARFVRSAAEVGADSSLAEIEKEILAIAPKHEPEVLKPEDGLIIGQQLVLKARGTRETFHIHQAEEVLLEILAKSSELIYSIDGLEQRVIVERMLRSELFEHHSWLLDYRISRNQIVEALVHAEACRIYMNFISVGKEAIENLIALQGLLYLLLGKYDRALELFKAVPQMDPELSSTQILGLAVALIATNQQNEAALLIKRNSEMLEGLITSMHAYANDLYSHEQRELAINILKFLVKNFAKQDEVDRSIYRLFVLTRLRQDLIKGEVKIQKIFKKKLRNRGIDDSKSGIPKSIMNKIPIVLSTGEDPKEIEQFKGFYHILDLIEDKEKDEILAIAWNENNNSTWQLLFDSAYKPALEESVKIRITSGNITRIRKAKRTEPIRATLYFESPTIQPELVKPW
ncbi:MAG: tetratricopeptide repeat protein [Candidatus Hodarchaeales archaeon]